MKARVLQWCLPALLVFGCNPSKEQQPGAISGFGDYIFGEPMATAVAKAPPSYFSRYTLLQCYNQLAVRGCVLRPENNLSPIVTLGGVPFSLELSFNKFDKLTDIELAFKRDTMDSKDERVTLEECRGINDRALDWAAKTYGRFLAKGPNSPTTGKILQTKGGAEYEISDDDKSSFVADASHGFAGGRSMIVMSHFIPTGDETSCRVGITFRESDAVERWTLSEDEKKLMRDLDKP